MNPNPGIRWGLVGYGDLADKRVAAALQEAPGSSLSSVWGRDPAKAAAFARNHGIPKVHGDLDSLCGSDIEAVYVCTPPDSHADYALAAIAAGKHVLVEKPMAASTADCRRMIDAARRKGVVLGVAYYRRAHPKMLKIRELVRQGILGSPTWVNIACHAWFDPAPDDPKHWRVEKARSGGAGALADVGVHRLDLLEYWLGPAKVVFRDLHRLVHAHDVEDGASIVLRLAGGAPVHAYFSWNSRTWMDRFEITGSEAKLIADPLDSASLAVVRGRSREELSIEPPANAHLPCVGDFVAAVREGRAPLCDGAGGLRVNQLLDDILR